jgi:hypothetical protein
MAVNLNNYNRLFNLVDNSSLTIKNMDQQNRAIVNSALYAIKNNSYDEKLDSDILTVLQNKSLSKKEHKSSNFIVSFIKGVFNKLHLRTSSDDLLDKISALKKAIPETQSKLEETAAQIEQINVNYSKMEIDSKRLEKQIPIMALAQKSFSSLENSLKAVLHDALVKMKEAHPEYHDEKSLSNTPHHLRPILLEHNIFEARMQTESFSNLEKTKRVVSQETLDKMIDTLAKEVQPTDDDEKFMYNSYLQSLINLKSCNPKNFNKELKAMVQAWTSSVNFSSQLKKEGDDELKKLIQDKEALLKLANDLHVEKERLNQVLHPNTK